MNFDDFRALCDKRQSVRHFSDVPVRFDDVMKILDAAHLAPSVENIQPWRFHLIIQPDMKKKFSEASCYGNFVEGSSVFIVVTCDRSTKPSSGETIWNPKELEYSCMAAMMQMILAATAAGMGTCWVSLHHGLVHELLALPQTETIIGGVMLGNLPGAPAESAEHHERKLLKNVVKVHE